MSAAASSKKKRRPSAAHRDAVSEQLRRIIERRRMTPYAVALAADVAPSVATRFMNGERGLSTESLDRVAGALGLELRETRRGKAGRRETPAAPADGEPAEA